MALIRPSIDLRQFSFSEEGSTYNERSKNAFVSCRLCVCYVIARVRCHVLHSVEAPWTPARWFQVRTLLPEPPIKRSGGSGKGAGGAAAPCRAWAVAGRTATGGMAHFSYTACVHMFSFATCVARRSCSTDPVGNAAANSPLHSSQQGVKRQST